MASNPILHEIDRWSDLSSFLEAYNHEVVQNGDGIGRIFGYASIIGNHSAEKPENSKDIPNEPARLHGMEVAMNVYAAGEFEFRGTRDAENGIYNVGLYAGMEPATSEEGYADGVNITVAPEDLATSMIAYLRREIGNLPGDVTLEEAIILDADTGHLKLTEAGQEAVAALAGSQEDEFGLYKLQLAAVEKQDGSKAAALSVSTNENSPFAAIGLTPAQAAHYILDGQGYEREVPNGKLGGSALDYFQNALGSYEEFGLQQPRMQSIATEIETQAWAYRIMRAAEQHPALRDDVAGVNDELLTHHLNGVGTRLFENNIADRGEVTDDVRRANELPRTADDKGSRIAELSRSGKLEEVSSIADQLQSQGMISQDLQESSPRPDNTPPPPQSAPDVRRR